MVLISEWLPNPAGSDSVSEWIELTNTASGPADLRNWSIQSGSGKKFPLAGREIAPGGYLVLKRTETKITLPNTDGEIFLYDGSKLIDSARFYGTSPEGKSFSRNGNVFSFASPTPGAENETQQLALMKNSFPAGKILNQETAPNVFLLAVGVGIVFAAIALFVIQKNHELHKLFFGGD